MHVYRKYSACAVFVLLVVLLFESGHHARSFHVLRPDRNLDEVFSATNRCGEEVSSNGTVARENAAIFMLARNVDVQDAIESVRSLEEHWNHRYHYPYVFANNEPFSDAFIQALKQEVSGTAVFETIPEHMWGFRNDTPPEEKQQALENMAKMEEKHIPHAGSMDYHNMCRFYSGFFYELPALQQYDWYWRIEPDARYTCNIPYDPFKEMIANKKVYGYTIALWEVGSTAPSLFRTTDDYRRTQDLKTSSLWTAMHEASWAPVFFRDYVMSLFPSRNKEGDGWNLCHFWSNFEIASLAFYRSERYRSFFNHLDKTGGFHLERWGDAPVHSLALALFLHPSEIHWFADFGYKHGSLQHCPPFGEGCRCDCEPGEHAVEPVCLDRIRETVVAPT